MPPASLHPSRSLIKYDVAERNRYFFLHGFCMIFGLLWAPLRGAIFLFGIGFGVVLTKLVTLDVEFPLNLCSVQPKPVLGPGRRRLVWAIQWIAYRIAMFGAGINYVTVFCKENRDSNARIAVYGPHQSILDGCVLMAMSDFGDARTPTGVSAEVERHRPLLGFFGISLEFIYVDYEDADSKRAAVNGCKFRATNHDWKEIFQVFAAEGTTSAGREFLQIKKGAFLAGQPVQPYILEFPEWMDVLTGNTGKARNAARGAGWSSWCEDSSFLFLVWHQLTKPWCPLHITVLPAYYPSEEEKASPELFANNVQQKMSEASGHPISGCNNNDMNLAAFIHRNYPQLNYDDFRGECHLLENEFGAKAVLRPFIRQTFTEFIEISEHTSTISIEKSRKLFPNAQVEKSLEFKHFLRQKILSKTA